MKKWTALLLALCLCVCFAACSKDSIGSAPAATAAGHDLTAAEVNYWLMDTYSEEQEAIAPMVLPDVPLNEQSCPREGYETWYHYILDLALQNAANNYVIYDRAMADGYSLSEEGTASVDSLIQTVEMYAIMNGFQKADDYLASLYSKGCTMDSYREYLITTATAEEYLVSVQASLSPTEQETDAYYKEHREELDLVRLCVLSAPSEEDAIALAESIRHGEAYDTDSNAFCILEKNYAALTFGSWIEESPAAGDVTVVTDENGNAQVVLFLGSISGDQMLPNVRHILITPEASEDGIPTTEDWEAAYAEAEAILEEYMAGEQTEESFAALADSRSADTGSVGNGGLYEKINPLQMVAPFANWCFEEHRAGDVGLIATNYGYHIMYFCGNSATSYADAVAQSLLVQEKAEEWSADIEAAATFTLHSTNGLNDF